jgi:hypothetical protein
MDFFGTSKILESQLAHETLAYAEQKMGILGRHCCQVRDAHFIASKQTLTN